jgi:hypothetical protein
LLERSLREPVTPATVPALVVAGMHRSGTSFVASILHAAGYAMGEGLLAADRANVRGYFEDVAFLDLNRRMLQAAVPADDPGHADWGWTERETFDASALDAFDGEAAALIAARRAQGQPWGWKDPRTSLLLDFWDAHLPEARYVIVYRFPWDVADSMQRLGAEVFLRHPHYAYAIWRVYNRALLQFSQRHRDRVILVNAHALMRQPAQLPRLLASRFGLTMPEAREAEISGLADAALFVSRDGARDPLAMLARMIHPECADLLDQLERAADLPSGESWAPASTSAAALAPAPGAHGAAAPAVSAASAPPDTAVRASAPTPAIAIVIPCFDQGEFLIDAVASVERSRIAVPYELLIVNDGSREPRTVAILDRLRAAGYRVIDQGNRGLAEARNRGLAEAAAPVFLPLDADNRLRPGFVEAALDVLARDPAVAAVYGDRVEFGLRSGRVQVDVPDLDRLLFENNIDACAVIRADALRACGGYDAAMPAQGLEDWDLWLSMLERHMTLVRLDIAAFDYRVRPGSMNTRFQDPETLTVMERYVLAKHVTLYMERLRLHFDLFRSAGLR